MQVLNHAALQAAGETERPQGVLKITMPRWFANPKVAQILVQFQQKYPDVVLNLSLSNQMVDLVADGFDLALRLAHDPKPTLISRPLAVVDFYLLASPDYLARYGTPTMPDELIDHHIILPTYVKMDNLSVRHLATNTTHTIRPHAVMMSNDTPMNAELIRQGVGIGYAPSWLVEQDLAKGGLVRLLVDYDILSAQLCAVYVDRAFLRANVRAFIDFWVQKMGSHANG